MIRGHPLVYRDRPCPREHDWVRKQRKTYCRRCQQRFDPHTPTLVLLTEVVTTAQEQLADLRARMREQRVRVRRYEAMLRLAKARGL